MGANPQGPTEETVVASLETALHAVKDALDGWKTLNLDPPPADLEDMKITLRGLILLRTKNKRGLTPLKKLEVAASTAGAEVGSTSTRVAQDMRRGNTQHQNSQGRGKNCGIFRTVANQMGRTTSSKSKIQFRSRSHIYDHRTYWHLHFHNQETGRRQFHNQHQHRHHHHGGKVGRYGKTVRDTINTRRTTRVGHHLHKNMLGEEMTTVICHPPSSSSSFQHCFLLQVLLPAFFASGLSLLLIIMATIIMSA